MKAIIRDGMVERVVPDTERYDLTDAIVVAAPDDYEDRPYIWSGEDWAIDLAVCRARAVAKVDAEAEGIRCLFLTPGAGQAMTYQRKEAEARAFLADPEATTIFLSAEAPARGMTVAALAAEVAAQADAWAIVGAAIEALRMGAKAQIAAGGTDEIIAAAADVDWSAVTA